MYKVAVVGATGRVGSEMISILKERNFPISKLYAIASDSSAGKRIKFDETTTVIVQKLEGFDFSGIDIVLSTAGAEISAEFAERAVKQGALVIDNTSYFRNDPLIPLIIPEINLDQLSNYKTKGIISNPNCTTIQILLALAPLHKTFKIKRIVASTYQSVSGAGNEGLDELFNQTKNIYSNVNINYALEKDRVFTKQIAFNLIPHIDEFLEDGFTKEEQKIVLETQKILASNILVSATCVRVPVFIGHSVALNVEFVNDITEKQVREVLDKAPGVVVVDHRADEGYVTPFEAAGEDDVYVSRLRRDKTVKNGLSMWVVADNLRKGAALNAIQIAEEVIKFKA
ncbi:Aspartate-semialdehyde dehydrogenase [Candidatus Hepatincolaceae symbiont of Richtersius coronifer]